MPGLIKMTFQAFSEHVWEMETAGELVIKLYTEFTGFYLPIKLKSHHIKKGNVSVITENLVTGYENIRRKKNLIQY